MKAATSAKKGDADMKAVVLKARADMNEFVAVRDLHWRITPNPCDTLIMLTTSLSQFYRRNTKVAGAASFSTLYTAISTLSVSPVLQNTTVCSRPPFPKMRGLPGGAWTPRFVCPRRNCWSIIFTHFRTRR